MHYCTYVSLSAQVIMDGKINCLVMMPSSMDYQYLEKHKNNYNFFWAENDDVTTKFEETGGVYDPEKLYRFDAVQFVRNCVQMVKDNGISIVIATGDYSSLLASAVCEETGLPGTSVESQLLCYHKYYSRLTEGEECNLWFDYINLPESVDKATWSSKVKYPCRLKPHVLDIACIKRQFIMRKKWCRT